MMLITISARGGRERGAREQVRQFITILCTAVYYYIGERRGREGST